MSIDFEKILTAILNGEKVSIVGGNPVEAIALIQQAESYWQSALTILNGGQKANIRFTEVVIENALINECIALADNNNSRPVYDELCKLADVVQGVLQHVEKDETCLLQDDYLTWLMANNDNAIWNKWYYYEPTKDLKDWVAKIAELSKWFDESKTNGGDNVARSQPVRSGGNRAQTFASFFSDTTKIDEVQSSILQGDNTEMANYFDTLVRQGIMTDIPSAGALQGIGIDVDKNKWKRMAAYRRNNRR